MKLWGLAHGILIKTTMDKIHIKGSPEEAAKLAYQKGFYLEAIQIVHAWLENQAQELLMLIGIVHFEANEEDTWDLVNTFSFYDTIKILYALNHLTKNEFDSFAEFNSMRNKVIHKIYRQRHDETFEGPNKTDYDKIFNESLKQVWFFSNKSAEIIEINK